MKWNPSNSLKVGSRLWNMRSSKMMDAWMTLFAVCSFKILFTCSNCIFVSFILIPFKFSFYQPRDLRIIHVCGITCIVDICNLSIYDAAYRHYEATNEHRDRFEMVSALYFVPQPEICIHALFSRAIIPVKVVRWVAWGDVGNIGSGHHRGTSDIPIVSRTRPQIVSPGWGGSHVIARRETRQCIGRRTTLAAHPPPWILPQNWPPRPHPFLNINHDLSWPH